MTGEVCGAEHPEQPGTTCDRKPHRDVGWHKNNRTGAIWEADPLPVVEGSGRAALAAMAARATRHHHTGPASEAIPRKDRHG